MLSIYFRHDGHPPELEPTAAAVMLTITQVMERADSKLIDANSGGWPRVPPSPIAARHGAQAVKPETAAGSGANPASRTR
jgi:hypothetical protein